MRSNLVSKVVSSDRFLIHNLNPVTKIHLNEKLNIFHPERWNASEQNYFKVFFPATAWNFLDVIEINLHMHKKINGICTKSFNCFYVCCYFLDLFIFYFLHSKFTDYVLGSQKVSILNLGILHNSYSMPQIILMSFWKSYNVTPLPKRM